MSNIAKLEFAALDVSGKNYMSWMMDVKMYLESEGIENTITELSEWSKNQEKAMAIKFLRKHIDESLKFEYLEVREPCDLWNRLKERFDHQKEVILPNAREEWRTLRFQDFKKVNEYNSALFRICSQLKFCGHDITDEDMLEKTYSTFHASNITLMQQYRMQKFTKYSELIACLLVAEQNNELLIKNHESRPTGSVAIPEANATVTDGHRDNAHGRGRGRGSGRGRGRGRGYFNRNQNHNNGRERSNSYNRGRGRDHRGSNNHAPRRNNDHQQERAKKAKYDAGTSRNNNDACYRCGSTGHWSRTCRTPAHLCKLYQASLKGKGNEVNFIDNLESNNMELTNMDFNDVELPKLTADDFSNDMEYID
jgi:hypothetical protein